MIDNDLLQNVLSACDSLEMQEQSVNAQSVKDILDDVEPEPYTLEDIQRVISQRDHYVLNVNTFVYERKDA